MPRARRVEIAGGIHHVTARAPSHRVLFRDDSDRRFYLELYGAEAQLREWRVYSYCLMTNHVHHLLMTPNADLGGGFKSVHETYVRYFNCKYDEHGPLLGSRFHSKPVLTDGHLQACLRYLARNPVTGGLCASPGDYEWSAHRALAGDVPPPPFLSLEAVDEVFGGDRRGPIAYRNLAALDDRELVRDLASPGGLEWVSIALDVFAVPKQIVAEQLGVSVRTLERRLAVAVGSGPSGDSVAVGSGPAGVSSAA